MGSRPFRAVAGDQIMASRRSAHGLHRADGDHQGVVAGRQGGAASVDALRVVPPVVPRRDYHDYAGLPRPFHRLAQRVQLIALVNRSAAREADHTDVVLRFEAEDLLNGRDHTTVRSGPVHEG